MLKVFGTPDWQELSATLGAIISIIGFVLQFIGLRSLHWSASVAQLGAIGIMTVVRAWIRRGLLERPYTERLIPEHVMDWVTLNILQNPLTLFWKAVDEERRAASDCGLQTPNGQYTPDTRSYETGRRGAYQKTAFRAKRLRKLSSNGSDYSD